MARPELTGCPYFPLDCAYFEDRKLKLLRGEFGGKAETVVVRLWCMIYSDQGYYVKVDDDDIVLLADSLGRGFEANYMSNTDKLNVSAQMADRGIMNRDEIREIWNLPPLPNGEGQAYTIRGEYYLLGPGNTVTKKGDDLTGGS